VISSAPEPYSIFRPLGIANLRHLYSNKPMTRSAGARHSSSARSPLSNSGLYVQFGCGGSAPDGWSNFDASPRLRLERLPLLGALLCAAAGRVFPSNVAIGDIVRGLPVPEATARGVYCSHVLEHLARDDMPRALRNTFEMLAPGGRFRLVVPDLQWRAERYLDAARNADPTAADVLMGACRLGAREKDMHVMAVARRQLGHGAHLWMYDFAALRSLLEAAGFAGVRRCEAGDSGDPWFDAVEDRERFFDSGQRELAIEAVRPRAESLLVPR
jgi:predicted SAM-dependent methyltransferase